jgi:hypothetical protein
MNATAFQIGGFSVLLAVSVAAPLQTWRHGQDRLQATDAQFQRQATEMAELADGNARLSNLVAEARQDCLSKEGFHELVRLRGEMGTLRQAADEVEKLRAANDRARAQLAKAAAPPQLSDPQKVLAHWTKAQLAAAGFGDPGSAVETALCAMSRNDPAALADSVTPEAKTNMTRELWYHHAPAEEEIAKSTQRIADSLEPATGFSVVGQEFPAPDQASLEVYFEGEGRTRKFLMQQISGEWKLNSLGGAWP